MIGEERMLGFKRQLVAYASLVEGMIAKCERGLLTNARAVLTEVIEQDEKSVNACELEIYELCTAFIAQYQPKGKSLRTTLMSYKIATILERMGDHAVNIAQSSFYILDHETIALGEIPVMVEVTKRMLRDSIDAFVNEDVATARAVFERDTTVDDFKKRSLSSFISRMKLSPDLIEPYVSLLIISRNLERIADLSTNICESTIFMVEGKVVAHHHDD